MAQLVRIDCTPPSSSDEEVHLKDKKQSASAPAPRYNRTTASTKISIVCACEMGMLGVADRYIGAFCGRVSKSVLARHYTDYSPEKLKR